MTETVKLSVLGDVFRGIAEGEGRVQEAPWGFWFQQVIEKEV